MSATTTEKVKRYRETSGGSDSLEAGLERQLRAIVRRAGEGDIEALAVLQRLADQLPGLMTDAVAGLRSEDGGCHSWTEIGGALGVGRSAAQERFAKAGAGARRVGGQPAHLR